MSDAPSPQRPRLEQIDALRIVAFALVVVLHAVTAPHLSTLQASTILDGLSRVAVPCFFLVSGYFVPATPDPARYLVRLLTRLAPVFLVWEAAYIAGYALGLPFVSPESTWADQSLTFKIVNTLTEGGLAYHLWFLPSLFLSLAAFVVLRHIAGPRVTLVLALLLYLTGLALGPYNEALGLYDTLARHLPEPQTLTFRNGIAFGLLYIAVGNALARHPARIGRHWLVLALVAGFLVQELEFGVLAATSTHGRALAIDYGLGTVLYATATFLLALSAPASGWTTRLARIGRLALGLYCVHILVLDTLRNTVLAGLGYAGAPAVALRLGLAVAVIAVSVAIIAALNRLPPLRRLIR